MPIRACGSAWPRPCSRCTCSRCSRGSAWRRRSRSSTSGDSTAVSDLAALDAITEAVESGAGLPEVVRAAAKALDASLAVTDAWGATPAGAAPPPPPARSLLTQGKGVNSTPLRVADTIVGTLHMRAKSDPSASMQRLLVTMIASEVERVRAPERASESAAADFLRSVLARELTGREELVGRAKDLALDVQDG